MEGIIMKLLVGNNDTIQQGTSELRNAFKDPNSTPALCQIVMSSTNPEVRQYAAVLLRKRYNKGQNWSKLPEHIRKEFKAVILQSLVNETEKCVKNAVAQLIGVIIKHEISTNNWPEVWQFMEQLLLSDNKSDKEVREILNNIKCSKLGTYTLSIVTEITTDSYFIYARPLVEHLARMINTFDLRASTIQYYILKTMLHLIPLAKRDHTVLNKYHEMMPEVLTVIQNFVVTDELKAIECFELLDELCENISTVITPHVIPLMNLCLATATNNSLSEALRIKAINFIGWLAKTKKKIFVKYELIQPIIDTLFRIMITWRSNDCNDYHANEENEDNALLTCTTQALDLLALHLPPDQLIPCVLRHTESGLQSTDIYAKKASYVALAILAEGCSECIRSNYLNHLLPHIYQGIRDISLVVRNAALFALGQFSEHLQPEISEYSCQLLPVLFEYLSQVCSYIKQENKEPPSINRMFYALEVFCENLNESLLPYLPTLMQRLFEILDTDTPVHVKKLSLSAIGSVACASKEHMLPYFERIVTILNGYLVEKQTEETICLQIQAIDTLGIIARTIGEQNFQPLVVRSVDIGITLLKNTEDPDLRKSIYGLFACISTVIKKDMATILPIIFEYMMNSIQSSEGIVTYLKDDGTSTFLVYEDLSENENEEEDIENTDNEEDSDDEDIAGYSVENAYIEEKEEVILALKEIAQYTEEAFYPYLGQSFEETYKLINYPHEDIRKASIDALLQFCINFSKIDSNEGRQGLLNALSVFIPKLSELIKLDEEPTIAINSLDAYTKLLKEIKSDVLVGEGHKEAIINRVTDVMTGKTECQDREEIEDIGTEAEQYELLLECAGDVLTNFGKAISPEDFALYFQSVLPLLLERLKKNKSTMQRSFAIGTISECLSGLQHTVTAFVPQLIPIFLRLTQDSSGEVRNNVIFGIGELALYGKEAVYPHYSEILQVLSNVLEKESHAGTRDNIVGAIARLIITNYCGLPLDRVFPVFIEQLPLKKDFIENASVFKSILTLYQVGHIVLKPHIHTLLKIGITVLYEEKTGSDEAKSLIIEFIKSAQQDFPNEWNAVYSELPLQTITNVQRVFA